MREAELKGELEVQATRLSVELGEREPAPTPTEQEAKKEWEVERKEIKLIKKLGEGRFKEVWEGMWNEKRVAVKTIKSGKTMSAEEFLKETEIMKCISHKTLVELFAVCTREEPMYIVIELMTNGSLLDYLRRNKASLDQKQLIEMCGEIAEGMVRLELRNCVHRDLAARNILVSGNLTCKVGNFGLACIDYREDRTPIKLPIKWTAPESAKHRRFTVKSDVWSFGIVLYEAITYGKLPYVGMTNAEVLEKVQQGYRMPKPSGCPNKLYDIMLQCWKEKPEDRSTFEALQFQMEDFFATAQYQYINIPN